MVTFTTLRGLASRLLGISVGVLLLASCGTTALVLKPVDQSVKLTDYKALIIETSTAPDVVVPQFSKTRIKNLVQTEINGWCCPKYLKEVSTRPAEPEDLVLDVRFTIYDGGNRFARFMLAGLGSMQIHAEIELRDSKSGNIVAGGEAGKTFAWGGVYGAITGIEDLEKDFAKEVSKGVAEALGLPTPLNQTEQGAKKEQ